MVEKVELPADRTAWVAYSPLGPQCLPFGFVQGGWFALPDPGLYQQFQSRYSAAYGEAPPPVAGLAYDGIAGHRRAGRAQQRR